MVAELADEGDEKLMQLLTHVRDWNTHSRSCRVAQVTHAPPFPPTQPRRRNPQPRRAAHTAFDDYLFHECSDENTQLLNQHLSEASSPLPPATAADLQAQPPLNPPLTLSPVPTAGAAEGAALDHPSDPAGQAPRHEVDDRVAAAVLGEGERHCLSLRFCCRSVKD